MHRKILLCSVLQLLILLCCPSFSHSQPVSGSKSEELRAQIRKHAERHVINDQPIQTQLIVDLYRDNDVGMSAREIAQVYEEAFTFYKQNKKLSFWDRASSKAPWIMAVVLFLLLIFRDAVKDWLSSFLKYLGSLLYARLAGSPSLRRVAVRQYRKALNRKYSKLHLPFRPNRPLDLSTVYVPIRIAGNTTLPHVDAYEAINRHRKILIKGQPGAGKSTLLKHITFTFSAGITSKVSSHFIPILFELHRLNNSSKTLEEHLNEEMGRNGFPNATRFISNNLQRGKLILLFDGLDEVNSDERPTVVAKIKDLAHTYWRCRIVITCRSAVYRGEFADSVDESYEVIEFDDQQILRFMKSWEIDMPQEKSVDQLIKALRDVPRIMVLARNPLLLTIIAFLYTDDPSYILPNSRAEFYNQSTDLLLRHWHQERNRFDARAKRQVLQHLALYCQDTGNENNQDRLSIEADDAIEKLIELIPNLNLRKELDPQLLVDEIVERSGLLLSIDNGARYQFTHLTMQEFFAALKLLEDQDGLIRRFHSDPDRWRETLKLWCGLVQDSTNVIRNTYDQDPLTAFECIADAQYIDTDLADHIIDGFKSRLTEETQNEFVIRAFGAVASDLGPRGHNTLNFLKKVVTKSEKVSSRAAAAHALSLTSLPQVAQLLSELYVLQPEVRPALARMGDLAVPELSALAQLGVYDSIDSLQAIGTPEAAKALAELLWHQNSKWASYASWRLASLLADPNVETALINVAKSRNSQASLSSVDGRANHTDADHSREEDYTWMWAPFSASKTSALTQIVTRMVDLMVKTPVADLPSTTLALDPRLVIPFATILEPQEIDFDYKKGNIIELDAVIRSISGGNVLEVIVDNPKRDRDAEKRNVKVDIQKVVNSAIEQLAEGRKDPKTHELLQRFLELYYDFTNIQPRLKYLLRCLPAPLQVDVLKRLIETTTFHQDDWINVFNPSTSQFTHSWCYRALLLIGGGMHLLATWMLIRSALSGAINFGKTPTVAVLVGTTLITLIWVAFVGLGQEDFWPKGAFIFIALIGPVMLAWLIYKLILLSLDKSLTAKRMKVKLVEVFFFLPAISWIPVEIYFATKWLREKTSLKAAWIAWSLVLLASLFLWSYGKVREWVSENPLHGILEEQAGLTELNGKLA